MEKIAVKRLIILASIGLSITTAKADGLFMGSNWAGDVPSRYVPASIDPQPRAEDNDGIRAYKLNRFSVQVPFNGQPFAGRNVPDGICDDLQPKAWDNNGIMAWKNAQPTHYLYAPGSVGCTPTYYPGFTFFGGQPNMALAPHDNGQYWPQYGVGLFGTRWGG